MSPGKRVETHTEPASTERKLIRVRGVRAKPGGWVWVNELADGWATFPDRGAGGRRWQWGIGILIVILIPVDALVQHYRADLIWPQFWISAAIIVLIVALVAIGNLTDERKAISRRRAGYQSMLQAGGKQALRGAIRTHGLARTVGEMNILISSLGRNDPVFSTRRIAKSTVDRHWLRTTVHLTLTGNHALSYRTYGVRSPAKLARVFEPQVQPQVQPRAQRS